MTLGFREDGFLDRTDWRILALLQKDARITYRELGHAVGLSAPAVAERIRKLEDRGVIRGYRVDIDWKNVGLPVEAFIRLTTPREASRRVSAQLQQIQEIMGCWRVAGPDSFILRVGVSSMEHLEWLIDRLARFGQSVTSIVLSTTFAERLVETLPMDWKTHSPSHEPS
ncbi:Lrp/AsnC family transcriptional regulator [Sulfobacillus thermosulfidooxidans]|uniref:Lrp/AsnC family transcriptional regulator n=1 Tax=Sulfobacillus thermosulfidooxidans TaxID=28034 RepID=UPI0009E8CE04|nr:Lrp/AsnC family transcriptional regulator [Sulfobacillus thermosulfidooxidans]